MDESLIAPTSPIPTSSLTKVPLPNPRADSFAFIMNISRLVGADRFTLIHGYELRRATPSEIQKIRELLAPTERGLLGLRYLPWECQTEKHGAGHRQVRLPEAEWKYFVMASRDINGTNLDLEFAFSLAQLELQEGFAVGASYYVEGELYPTTVCHPGRLFQRLDRFTLGKERLYEVTESGTAQVSEIYQQLKAHDSGVVNIRRVLLQIQDFESIRYGSAAQFLAYFGILESLLTHKPDPKDQYDSITRQVKKKLALLDNRWSPGLDYAAFRQAKPEVVWGKMYAYRSSLAHGDAPDFKKDLHVLASPDVAMELLRSAMKAVIRLALVEPRLIADLKDC